MRFENRNGHWIQIPDNFDKGGVKQLISWPRFEAMMQGRCNDTLNKGERIEQVEVTQHGIYITIGACE